jgi:DNA polymerase-1
MIKIAMIRIHEDLQKHKLQTKMTMQVHDELVFDAPRSELETVMPIIREHMKSAIATEVPIVVEIGYGENWLSAH